MLDDIPDAALDRLAAQGFDWVRPFADLRDRRWRLHDLIGGVTYDRDGRDLQACGLYLDEPPWQCHAFTMVETRDEAR